MTKRYDGKDRNAMVNARIMPCEEESSSRAFDRIRVPVDR